MFVYEYICIHNYVLIEMSKYVIIKYFLVDDLHWDVPIYMGYVKAKNTERCNNLMVEGRGREPIVGVREGRAHQQYDPVRDKRNLHSGYAIYILLLVANFSWTSLMPPFHLH